jgi:hypothetical protein
MSPDGVTFELDVLERFFNSLDVIRGIGGGILFTGIGIAAISYDDLAGWLIGAFLVPWGVWCFVGPIVRPRYRSPRT